MKREIKVREIIEGLIAKTDSDELRWTVSDEFNVRTFQADYNGSQMVCNIESDAWLQVDGWEIDNQLKKEDKNRIKSLVEAIKRQLGRLYQVKYRPYPSIMKGCPQTSQRPVSA